jgi:heme/copper-type cytochrome/quinol oxidase subunit 3
MANCALTPEKMPWHPFSSNDGFHAFHVLTGLIFLGIVYRNARKGLYSAERHWPVKLLLSTGTLST